jgi:hypothetical protein
VWDKFGMFVSDESGDRFKLDECNMLLGRAYVTIAEVKLLDVIDGSLKPEEKAKSIKAEYAKIAKFAKQTDFKIKSFMHATLKSEADSILLSA